jgi:AcrR family transcriptional regulator
MVVHRASVDRKEQIVSAAIDRLFAVGFEGFRVGDVAREVGINNATLIHHYPSKVALIRAVVERFTKRFEAVAHETNTEGTTSEKLARHMRSSLELMRTSPEMFVVLNEIMVRARRDGEIACLVSVPLKAWQQYIVSLLLALENDSDAEARSRANEIATACMSQLLGMGLLVTSTHLAEQPFEQVRGLTDSRAIAALAELATQDKSHKGAE